MSSIAQFSSNFFDKLKPERDNNFVCRLKLSILPLLLLVNVMHIFEINFTLDINTKPL